MGRGVGEYSPAQARVARRATRSCIAARTLVEGEKGAAGSSSSAQWTVGHPVSRNTQSPGMADGWVVVVVLVLVLVLGGCLATLAGQGETCPPPSLANTSQGACAVFKHS